MPTCGGCPTLNAGLGTDHTQTVSTNTKRSVIKQGKETRRLDLNQAESTAKSFARVSFKREMGRSVLE